MDGARYPAEKSTTREDDNQDPATRFPAPTLSTPPSPSPTSSHDSERSVLDAATRVHPPTPDMDGPDPYIRRRPLLMENEDPRPGPKPEKRSRSHRHRRKLPADAEHQHAAYSSDDGHSSIYSTASASEDVEMEPLGSDDALTDDEETGLTGKDRRKRKRRRTLNTKLDERVAGSTGASPSGWSLADRNVIKASLINILLIASWYLFSVSISVVGRPCAEAGQELELTNLIVQQMDVRRKEETTEFPFPSLHDLHAHGCAVSTRLDCLVFLPTFSPPSRRHYQPRESSFSSSRSIARQTPHESDVLLHSDWSMWNGNRSRYRTREHEFQMGYADILQ